MDNVVLKVKRLTLKISGLITQKKYEREIIVSIKVLFTATDINQSISFSLEKVIFGFY